MRRGLAGQPRGVPTLPRQVALTLAGIADTLRWPDSSLLFHCLTPVATLVSNPAAPGSVHEHLN
jgi:hypothetical protein